MTIPDCRCQDTVRPTSHSSSWESQWGQHEFLPKSWSGSAVLALGGNFICSKPAGTPEQGISWNTQGNYTIRTNPLHLSVTTMGGQRERIFCVMPMMVQQLWTFPIRLLLYVLLSRKRQIRFSAVWHLAEQCLPWQGLSGSAHPGVFKTDEHWASPAALESTV